MEEITLFHRYGRFGSVAVERSCGVVRYSFALASDYEVRS